ncbi:MAG: DUF4258 domain-containing protein [Ferruginibacter sp.]|nr:DUF4258 domain-containing protein [Ferruginibacter sp.]
MINKKYLPYLVLLLAALLLYYVKKNQRGASVPQRSEVTIPAETELPFSRTGKIIYSKHARCRMGCRQIDESEVEEILQTGQLNEAKIEEDQRGKTYPLEGMTHDRQRVRIVFAPKQAELVVVTVIDLEKDWSCNCN